MSARLRNPFILAPVGGVVLGAIVVLLVTFAAALQGEPRPAPEATVRQYYFLINNKQLDEAYRLLSTDSPARRPFDVWSQAVGETASVDVKSAILRDTADSEAEVYIEIEAVDVLSDGTEIERQFAGTWQLVWADGRWLLNTPSVRQTGEEVRAPRTTPPAAPTRTLPTPTPTFPVVRKIILVGGIDSAGSCSSDSVFLARRDTVMKILQPYVPGLKLEDIQGLSYAEPFDQGYAYCATPITEKPITGEVPIYTKRDTCGGVAKGSQALRWLINHLLQSNPGTEFDIVAHSMGGLVASYYVAQQDGEFLKQHIHSIVLLDSPVSPGLQIESSPLSACSLSDPSWQDMLAGSGVIGSISDPSRTTLRVRFSAVLATPIGEWLPGMSANNVRYAQGYTSGAAGAAALGGANGGAIGCLLGGPIGCLLGAVVGEVAGEYVLDVLPEHSAVWYDPITAQVIREAVTAP
jgi:hypothetical protein